MDGTDYQTALALQRQIEQESSYAVDFHLALELQNDFNRELSTEKSNDLVYNYKKKSQDTKSLVDASWELIDPTPNIYNLFVVFNEQFFWNRLLAVCVSWSKRMTSCAGICSYQGRGGMCSITLSEPLLKLRPRKDLVETLLHEMIHAYLFVTHNNRDRDGHGPEFHKHMYRINTEAGTNITVYHTFHDEVRLYQQHWWRCNGPCQNKKPYFGMVRRATNRAPGPNDRWWNEHFHSCGGTFIKVREPEKKVNGDKKNKPNLGKSMGDIRNFIPVINKSGSVTSNSKVFNENFQNQNINVYKISTISSSTQTNAVSQVTGPGNVHSFVNANLHQSNMVTKRKVNTINAATKTKTNSNSTVTVTQKSSNNNNDNNNKSKSNNQIIENKFRVYSGIGNCLTQPDKAVSKNDEYDYSIVRNHWLNKYPISSVNKRNNLESSAIDKTSKKLKSHEINVIDLVDSDSFVTCPVCNKQIKEPLLNDHLDSCLEKQVLVASTENEVMQVDHGNLVDKCDSTSENELIQCEICNEYFHKSKVVGHQSICIENIFSNSLQKSTEETSLIPKRLNKPSSDICMSQCPMCDEFIELSNLNSHKEKCLLNVFNDLEKKHNSDYNDKEVLCLVCNKKIFKNELTTHLDDCMTDIFDENNCFGEDFKEDKTGDPENHSCSKTSIPNKYNCPFCMALYSELDMSGHLDQCLADDQNNCDNKTILVDSLSGDNLL